MIRFPLVINFVLLLLLSAGIYFALSILPQNKALDFKWFFPFSALTVGLLAQTYFKLQDAKFTANASVSELNRMSTRINIRKSAIIKLIFFHLLFGLLSGLILLFNLTPTIEQLIFASSLSFVILWAVSLLFGYLAYEELADLNSHLLKRKLERESRQASLKALNKA